MNAWCVSFAEYFFDVTWVGFNSILGVYRSGTLHLANGVCAIVTREYWTFNPSPELVRQIINLLRPLPTSVPDVRRFEIEYIHIRN